MNVGIVGQRFVGSAVREGLKGFHEVRTYDIKHELRDCDSLAALVRKSEIMFVCLPTPMRKDGSCDVKLLHSVVRDTANAGIYYRKKGSDYVRLAEQMITKDVRTNNEFYVCPVFNEAIEAGLKIKNYQIEKMWGMGTPEDLASFTERKQ